MNQIKLLLAMRPNSSIFKFAVTALIAISFATICTSSTAYAKKKVKYGQILVTTNPAGLPISIDGGRKAAPPPISGPSNWNLVITL